MKKIKSEPIRYLAYLLCLSIAFMTMGSMTSFLFPLHVGVDQNCFFTIGASVLDGKVLYRDIYDQKGPLLFFVHTLSALISRNSFIGVYIVEIMNFTVILFYFGKISDRFLDRKYRNIVVAVTGLVIVTAFCFSRGDNAEEFCMTFLVIAIYHMLEYLESKNKQLSYKILCLHGIFAACILWIKFTMLGFYIGWCLVIGVTILVRKNWLEAWKSAGMFLVGMILGTIPYILYFWMNDAMSDFIFAYFTTNVCMYSNQVSMMDKIVSFFTKDILWNPVFMPLTLLGLYWLMGKKSMLHTKEAKIGMLVTYVLLYFFVFIGGTRYRYYILIFGAYVVFGVIFLVKNYHGYIDRWRENRKVYLITTFILFTMVLCLASNCLLFLGKPKAEYPQIQIAKIVNQVKDATILNYNFLDGGFYLSTGSKLPNTRFFCRQNIPRQAWPQLYEEQEALIANKEVTFVVVRYGRGRALDEFVESEELGVYYTKIRTVYEEIDNYYYALYALNEIANTIESK